MVVNVSTKNNINADIMPKSFIHSKSLNINMQMTMPHKYCHVNNAIFSERDDVSVSHISCKLKLMKKTIEIYTIDNVYNTNGFNTFTPI